MITFYNSDDALSELKENYNQNNQEYTEKETHKEDTENKENVTNKLKNDVLIANLMMLQNSIDLSEKISDRILESEKNRIELRWFLLLLLFLGLFSSFYFLFFIVDANHTVQYIGALSLILTEIFTMLKMFTVFSLDDKYIQTYDAIAKQQFNYLLKYNENELNENQKNKDNNTEQE